MRLKRTTVAFLATIAAVVFLACAMLVPPRDNPPFPFLHGGQLQWVRTNLFARQPLMRKSIAQWDSGQKQPEGSFVFSSEWVMRGGEDETLCQRQYLLPKSVENLEADISELCRKSPRTSKGKAMYRQQAPHQLHVDDGSRDGWLVYWQPGPTANTCLINLNIMRPTTLLDRLVAAMRGTYRKP